MLWTVDYSVVGDDERTVIVLADGHNEAIVRAVTMLPFLAVRSIDDVRLVDVGGLGWAEDIAQQCFDRLTHWAQGTNNCIFIPAYTAALNLHNDVHIAIQIALDDRDEADARNDAKVCFGIS